MEDMMDYLFVFSDGGWYLKLDNAEKLADYHEKTRDGKYGDALSMYLHNGSPDEILEKLNMEERIKMMQDRNFKYLQVAVMQARKGNGTILDGFRWMNIEIGMNQLKHIEEHGAIYINSAGGYTFGLEYEQFCRRKNLVFPNFKESDIRIKQFEGGEHYYAYVGDMQVRDGDALKWFSRDEAYSKALSLINSAFSRERELWVIPK